MTISVDLKKQEYPVFKFKDQENNFEFEHKNFIFGKNGTGKSTLTDIIYEQFQLEYDMYIFSGLDNIVENNKLNALVLGTENIEAQKKLDRINKELEKNSLTKQKLEKKLKSLQWQTHYKEEGIEMSSFYEKKVQVQGKLDLQEKKMDAFYRKKAKDIKETDSPIITRNNKKYDKNDFKNEIKDKILLKVEEIEQFKSTLQDSSKKGTENYENIEDYNYKDIFNSVNRILSYTINSISVDISNLDSPQKVQFAQDGLEIHEVGDMCSFCGNEIKETRIKELKTYVDLPDIQKFEKDIANQLHRIDKEKIDIKSIQLLDENKFYIELHQEIRQINNELEYKKKEHLNFLDSLKVSLERRKVNIFSSIEVLNDAMISEISDFKLINTRVEDIIVKHNTKIKNLKQEKNKAKDSLRYHYIYKALDETIEFDNDWLGYIEENKTLERLKTQLKEIKENIEIEISTIRGSEIEPKNGTILFLNNSSNQLEADKVEVISQTKSTEKLVEIINQKLKNSGKTNLELKLVNEDIEHYEIKDGESTRSIDNISTGEKNIIGFLYFMETVRNIEKGNSKKIVIFDDPMNSNDDTMQYLIITEIQNLYRGIDLDKFNPDRDYFLCLTHNAHFYLNVQPNGNHKDRNGKTKYDKNGYYRLENGGIKQITSDKEDFGTYYESLWIELQSLYENDLLNSMLNSMRRIIETYMKFNKITSDNFYKDLNEHLKLFNVNSHSIDDHSMETIGKTKEQLLDMFKNIFDSNNALNHFNVYWKS